MSHFRLPPLNALRAFEAAARLQSFSRAADEIHVTHGAVSHQIRALEAHVGVRLFMRQGRGVVLTDSGRLLAEHTQAAFRQIAEAADALGRRRHGNRLTVSVLPSLASRWLMPRIGRFMACHPSWEVNVETTTELADFVRDEVDVAIRYGNGPWPGTHSEWLMDDEYIMVASPRYNGGRLPKRVQDLPRQRFLRTDPEAWRAWCAAAGVTIPVPTTGLESTDAGLMLQAAIEGQGIKLTRRSIAQANLEDGTLVQLFDIAVPSTRAYHIVWPDHVPPSERVLAFRDWLLEETGRMEAGRKAARAARASARP